MPLVSLDEAKQHLRIDGTEDDNYITMLIEASTQFMNDMTGKTFDDTNNLAKTLCLLMVGDFYDRRTLVVGKVGEKISEIVNLIITQLSLSGGDAV